MNYGRFFRLNTEKSDLINGVAIFDYIWLEDENALSNETPKYPIYVVVTKECVEFKGHFYEKIQPQNTNKTHIHNNILSLPLSANLEVKDGLTKSLVEGYDTAFPSLKNFYLVHLLMKAVLKDKNEIAYSNLDIFYKDGKHVREIIIKKYGNKFIEGFIRKLILDFLFDLEHTKVFHNSPYYEHISIKLKENFFFNALANKAMYYYCREIANKENDKLFFLKNFFLPAEEQWLKSITNAYSDSFFAIDKKGWFKNPEDELTNIYKKSPNGIMLYDEIPENNDNKEKKDTIKEKLGKITKDVSKWQLQKYDLWGALPISMGLVSAVIIIFVYSFFLSANINTGQTLLGIISLLLLFGIIPIEIYNNTKLRYSWGIHFFLPRLLGAIIAGWLMISFASNILPHFYAIDFDNCELGIKNGLIIFVLFILTGVFVYDGINRRVPYLEKKWRKKVLRTLYLMLIAFFYSYIIGIFTTVLIGSQAITSKNLDEFDYTKSPISVSIELFNSTAYISPSFLFVFTFVAMFIGLFINRIFEDKQVVDSE